MTNLSDEEKNLIKQEFDALVNENEEVLNEFKLYHGVASRIWLFFVGGSIAGILGAKTYIDDRISDRAIQFDNLYVANNLSGTDPASAYDLLRKFKGANLIENKRLDLSSLSDSQKTYFFSTALKILAYVPTEDNKDSRHYVGKTRWQALLADDDFQALPSSTKNSYDFNLQMGIAKLRYADTKQDIETSIPNLDSALKTSNSLVMQSNVAWYLGMAKLVLGHEDAISKLSMIYNESYPKYSSIYYANYVNSVEINDVINYDLTLFSNIWKRLSKEGFVKSVKKAVIEAQLMSRISSFTELNNPDKKNKTLEDINKQRYNFIRSFKSNNQIEINKLLHRNIYGYGFRNTIHFDNIHVFDKYESKDIQNAGKIVDVSRVADDLFISVEYCEENASCVWQFSQNHGDPKEWKIVYFPESNSLFDSRQNYFINPISTSQHQITKKVRSRRSKN